MGALVMLALGFLVVLGWRCLRVAGLAEGGAGAVGQGGRRFAAGAVTLLRGGAGRRGLDKGEATIGAGVVDLELLAV